MKDEIEKLNKDLLLPDYDVLLLGDGSGTIASKASAWSCFRYLKDVNKLEFHYGAHSLGTNNYVELLPYFTVLWLDLYERHATPRRVQIVSDSELTVRQGRREYQRNANGFLWNGLDYLESVGYNIMYKHVARNSNVLHAACDALAGRLRKEMEGFRLTAHKECGIISRVD